MCTVSTPKPGETSRNIPWPLLDINPTILCLVGWATGPGDSQMPSTNNQPCWLYGIFSALTHTSCGQQCCCFSLNSSPWLNGFWIPVPCTGSEDSWGDEAIKCFSQIVPESSCPPFFLSAHPSAAHGCWCDL